MEPDFLRPGATDDDHVAVDPHLDRRIVDLDDQGSFDVLMRRIVATKSDTWVNPAASVAPARPWPEDRERRRHQAATRAVASTITGESRSISCDPLAAFKAKTAVERSLAAADARVPLSSTSATSAAV